MADRTMFCVRVFTFAFALAAVLTLSHGNVDVQQKSDSVREEVQNSDAVTVNNVEKSNKPSSGSAELNEEEINSATGTGENSPDDVNLATIAADGSSKGTHDEETLKADLSDSKDSGDVPGTEHVDEDDSNSTLLMWFKSSFVDPIFEEFSNGLTTKSNESTNEELVNSTDQNLNLSSINTAHMNMTEPVFSNKTDQENTSSSDANKKQKFECTGRNVTDNSNATVKVITTARLLQLLSAEKNETENVTDCLLVMFYAPWCHFCAKTAPHYNALARAFPQMDFVAVDTAQFSNMLARFGTVSVPTVLVFHQSRAAVRFNQTERTFENFVTFVKNTTGLEPNTTVNVTEADHLGPVPSVPTDDTDYLLIISWIFVIFCSGCMFIKSSRGQHCIRQVRQLWQEHQHID